MSQKHPNTSIRCRVSNCAYHCGNEDCCSLNAIQVVPCPNCDSGREQDESMCASYRHE